MVTEKRSNEELKALRLSALAHLQLGAVYRHKMSGSYYVLKDVGISETKLELMVIYGPLKENGVVWIRSFDEWREKFSRIEI